MSKKANEVENVKTNNDVVNGKPITEIKEAMESLKIQLKNHTEKFTYHQTMATKAQGALEVLAQMLPQQEEENK